MSDTEKYEQEYLNWTVAASQPVNPSQGFWNSLPPKVKKS